MLLHCQGPPAVLHALSPELRPDSRMHMILKLPFLWHHRHGRSRPLLLLHLFCTADDLCSTWERPGSNEDLVRTGTDNLDELNIVDGLQRADLSIPVIRLLNEVLQQVWKVLCCMASSNASPA
jgi:hypothetical protein